MTFFSKIKLATVFILLLPIFSHAANIGWVPAVVDYINKGGPKPPAIPSCLSVPSNSLFQTDYNISWCSVNNASYYELLEANSGVVYSGTDTSYTDNRADGNFAYKVRSCDDSGCSAYSELAVITVAPVAIPESPTNISIPTNIYELAEYALRWQAANGAVDYYEVEQTVNGETTVQQIYDTAELSFSLATGNYTYSIKACNSTGCSAGATQTVVVNEANVGNLYLDNPENNEGIPQSNDLNFFLNWPVQTGISKYQLSYQYVDLELVTHTVHSEVLGTESSVDITLPNNTINGDIVFYLTEYVGDQPSETRKVVGKLFRVLEKPVVTSFYANKDDDKRFTVAWDPVPNAEFYRFSFAYSMNGQRLTTTGAFENVKSSPVTFNIYNGTYPNSPDAGNISIYIEARTKNNAIQWSGWSAPQEYMWRTTSEGGTPPEILSTFPAKNAVLKVNEPVVLRADVTDDASIAKVVFNIRGPGVYPANVEDTEAPYEANFSDYFNGTTFGTYKVSVTAYDDYGKSTSTSYNVTRPTNIIPPPQVESVEALADGNFNVTWSGSEYAIRNHLIRNQQPEYGGVYHDYNLSLIHI